MKHKLYGLFSLVVLASMILAACSPAATATAVPQVTEPPAAQPTEAAAPTVEATQAGEAPTVEATTAAVPTTPAKSSRMGGWLDKVIFSAIPDAEPAVAQIDAGAVDMYAVAVPNATLYNKAKDDPALKLANTYGSSDQMILNTVQCADGSLNPFTNAKIREAMNWAIDRNYIAQEILGGLAKPKFTALTSAFADYSRYADVMSAIETKYAYNLDKAKEVVKTEMEGMGATMGADGKWVNKGKPVKIIGLIRTEDTRKEMGNYFANQLEALGFTVERQEKTRKEAGPIWQGDPETVRVPLLHRRLDQHRHQPR